MREYKFRGKTLDGNDWCYGYLVVKPDKQTLIEQCDELRRVSPQYVVNPETVGQCSGLKDHEGREIYEGDILKLPPEFGPASYLIVDWNGLLGAFQAYCKDVRGALSFVLALSCTVIGNVYDTPELLEVKDDE